MAGNISRPSNKREVFELGKIWKTVLDIGNFFLVELERLEVMLGLKLQHFDEFDLEVGEIRRKLALHYLELGELKKAAATMELAVQALRFQLGEEDVDFLLWNAVCGCMYHWAADYEKAVFLLEESLEISSSVFGPAVGRTQTIRRYLLRVHEHEGQFLRAIQVMNTVIEARPEQSDESREDLELRLYRLYREEGMVAIAIDHLLELLERPGLTTIGNEVWLLEAKAELARNYAELSCYGEALRIMTEVVESEVNHFGPDRLQLGRYLDFQAYLFYRIGDFEMAKKRLYDAYLLFWKHCGADDEDTRRLKKELDDFEQG